MEELKGGCAFTISNQRVGNNSCVKLLLLSKVAFIIAFISSPKHDDDSNHRVGMLPFAKAVITRRRPGPIANFSVFLPFWLYFWFFKGMKRQNGDNFKSDHCYCPSGFADSGGIKSVLWEAALVREPKGRGAFSPRCMQGALSP